MKRLIFILVLLTVALVGFRLGRSSLTSFSSGEGSGPVNESYPLPPPPPESQPYVPGEPVDVAGGLPILLETPMDGTVVSPPFEVAGRSLAGQVLVSVLGPAGDEIYSRRLDVVAAEGEYGRFTLTVGDIGQVGDFILRVSLSGSDDPDAVQTRQISFGRPDAVSVMVYFSNSQLDPWTDCQKVFPVSRSVTSRSSVFRSAIEELLAGPTDEESKVGYVTQLPDRVKIKSVGTDATGVVTVDFDRTLDRGVAGSCRVTAIRSQIESTLRQFPEVKGVVITVDGKSEGILQP
ncbi:MAG: GerMN domain-containing protein [bacterium]